MNLIRLGGGNTTWFTKTLETEVKSSRIEPYCHLADALASEAHQSIPASRDSLDALRWIVRAGAAAGHEQRGRRMRFGAFLPTYWDDYGESPIHVAINGAAKRPRRWATRGFGPTTR